MSTPYSAADWANRFVTNLPDGWFGQINLQNGDPTWTLIKALTMSFAYHKINQLDHAQLQMRVKTATGVNLENIAEDFLGNDFPRLAGESDASYAYRIIAAVIGPKNTLAAIAGAVNGYYTLFWHPNYGMIYPEIGLDVGIGGLDTRGGLDVLPQIYFPKPTPTVTVFDETSNPALSAAIGLQDYQFCVMIGDTIPAGGGFVLSKSHLARETYLFSSSYIVVVPDPPDPAIEAIVQRTKAAGFKPIYAETRSLY